MENAAGDQFYFTIREVKPEAPAESLAEVRARVVEDVKKLDAFDRLKADLERNRTIAATTDLKTLASGFKKPDSPVDAPLPLETFENVKVTGAAVGRQDLDTEELRTAVHAAAAKLGSLFKATKENQADRTLAIALPKSFAIAVVQLTGESPVVVEDLRTVNAMVADQMATAELVEIQREKGIESPISFEVMKEAAALKEVGVEKKKDDGAAKPAAK